MAKIKVISSYIGAYPGGRSAPALSSIPKALNTLLLSFAKEDGTGTFEVNWDTSSDNKITAQAITADKAANNRRFLVSLAGDAVPFAPTVSLQEWIDNAYNSLCKMIDTYHLDGVDCNYERIDAPESFTEAIGQLYQRLAAHYDGAFFSIAPFAQTWSNYKELLTSRYGQTITWNNYQLYASGITSEQDNINALKNIAEQTGWENLLFGINTNQNEPRGASPETALNVTTALKDQLQGVFTWCAEDSAPTFSVESQAAEKLNS